MKLDSPGYLSLPQKKIQVTGDRARNIPVCQLIRFQNYQLEVLEFLGYLGALLIGLILGLIGGGGSILTVPVLVYLFGITPILGTAYSLFIVGASSLVGTLNFMKKKLVDFRTAVVFSIPALVAVYLTRLYLVPAIPEHIVTLGDFHLTRGGFLMLFFAGIMILAAVSMIRDTKTKPMKSKEWHFRWFFVILEGLLVGLVTGLVGAGGGFLIIPALVLLAKLPMRKAVATSLLIIAVKSLIGFIGDVQNMAINWSFLLTFTAISIVGIFLGTWLNQFINGDQLKKGFGWFVLVMGILILLKELVI